MSFFGLARYGSDDERPAWSDTSSEDDSDAIGDDDEGVGPTSTGVAAPAAAPEPKTVLPSADDVFGAVKGPPAFLRPEATRPLASAHRNPTADGDGDGAGDRVGDDVDDASRKRRAVASATVSSAPKRYREDDIRARESALAGVEDVGDERRRSGTERGRPGDALAMAMLGLPQRKNTEPARAMDPAEFLAKGSGRALMPRKKRRTRTHGAGEEEATERTERSRLCRVEERGGDGPSATVRLTDRSARRPVSHRRSNAREGVTGYCVC